MALCLSSVSGLKQKRKGDVGGRVRLVDAAWVWTEPHSMRLKIRLTIQREVSAGGTILQQSFVVTFVVRNQQCVECQAAFRQGSWKSLVQVRQRVGHKRTFLYLEQLILKHGAHRGCLSIETFKDGMDFYFPDKGKAARFISFLEDVVPIKVRSLLKCQIDVTRWITNASLFITRLKVRRNSLARTINRTSRITSTQTSWRFAPYVKTIYSSFRRN